MSATLYALPVGNLKDVATQLRSIADGIERGEYGEVLEGAMAIHGGDGMEIFGLGRADSTVTHYMLCRAAAKMLRLDLP